jgi:hypothetical protein
LVRQFQQLPLGCCTLWWLYFQGGIVEENESVERLWELAEETFENAKENLSDAIEADYQFSLDDLNKILPDLAKRVFMMGFITGLETQLFDEDDDNDEGVN